MALVTSGSRLYRVPIIELIQLPSLTRLIHHVGLATIRLNVQQNRFETHGTDIHKVRLIIHNY